MSSIVTLFISCSRFWLAQLRLSFTRRSWCFFVASQDGFGELYQDLLRCPPIDISSDEDEDVAQGDIRGGGDGHHNRADDLSRQSGVIGAGQDNASVAVAVDSRDTRAGAEVAGHSRDTRGGAEEIIREADQIEEASLPQPDPIEATPGDRDHWRLARRRTARPTRWGRCERCGASMRAVYPTAPGASAFLGCTEFKTRGWNTCRFTRNAPPDRYHELPERAVARRNMQE